MIEIRVPHLNKTYLYVASDCMIEKDNHDDLLDLPTISLSEESFLLLKDWVEGKQ